MQRMLSNQKQIQKSLQKLMDEMKQSGAQGLGDLSGTAQEMEEVINEIKRKKYSRVTHKRQERILSRMLNAQKSLTTQGKKEERLATKSKQEGTFLGPAGLPSDLGQRQNLTTEALNQALKAGYSRDYQTMIRQYFHYLNQKNLLDVNEKHKTIIENLNEKQ